jgi:ferritin-like metal-binding protein YciE
MIENNQAITNLHNLLNYDASKFTSAEAELKNSLERWISKAESLQLKIVLRKYLDFVQENLQKMESFFIEENINAISVNNHVMLAYIMETDEKLNSCIDSAIIDACMLASIQAINHFKISMYGTAAAFANALEMQKHASVFHEAEVKEKQIDDRLSQLAEHEINIKAKTPFILQE